MGNGRFDRIGGEQGHQPEMTFVNALPAQNSALNESFNLRQNPSKIYFESFLVRRTLTMVIWLLTKFASNRAKSSIYVNLSSYWAIVLCMCISPPPQVSHTVLSGLSAWCRSLYVQSLSIVCIHLQDPSQHIVIFF